MRIAHALLCAPFCVPLAVSTRAVQAVPQESPDLAHEPPTLTAWGMAEVAAEPDRAFVSLGAAAQASEAAAAQREVSEALTRAIAAVRGAGIPEEALRTAGISLHPVYSDVPAARPPEGEDDAPREPRIVGYRASNTLRIRVDDVAQVGAVIDAGIGAGANQLEDLSFELQDDTPQRAEALRAAVANARQKAEALAEAAAVRLGRVQKIEAGGVETFAPVQHRALASFEAATPIQPGQVRVRATVTMTWRIEEEAGTGGR
jgi:uncharacterized protein YggE